MDPSAKAVNALVVMHGLKLKAYSHAGQVFVGCKHVCDLPAGTEITRTRAMEMLLDDVKVAAGIVTRCVSRPLSQGQFDALTMFCFEFGELGFRNSRVLSLLRQGDDAAAWAALADHDHGWVQTAQGQVRRFSRARFHRRLVEQKFFRAA